MNNLKQSGKMWGSVKRCWYQNLELAQLCSETWGGRKKGFTWWEDAVSQKRPNLLDEAGIMLLTLEKTEFAWWMSGVALGKANISLVDWKSCSRLHIGFSEPNLKINFGRRLPSIAILLFCCNRKVIFTDPIKIEKCAHHPFLWEKPRLQSPHRTKLLQ